MRASVNLDSTNDWTDVGSDRWASANGTFSKDVGFILFGAECTTNVDPADHGLLDAIFQELDPTFVPGGGPGQPRGLRVEVKDEGRVTP